VVSLSPDLVGFVRESLARGLPRAEVEQALLRAGWPAEQARQALAGFADIDFPVPVPRPQSSVSARDAFLQVVMLLTLLLSAYNLGALTFQLIDRAFPDPAVPPFQYSTLEGIRWSLSSLIVTAPIYGYVSWLVAAELRRNPIKRTSRIRRQLTYLTLFIASVVLIGDVTTVIYRFLGGEVTTRFVLKVLTVAAIAGAAFAYYTWDLRADEREPET
jgi:hypothetical protein